MAIPIPAGGAVSVDAAVGVQIPGGNSRVGSSATGWAKGGAAAGAAVSIAANVGHALTRPPDALPNWHPQLGAAAGAVWWPIALFIAIEVMMSHLWPRGRRWLALRLALAGPVAAVAAVVSYHHLSALLGYWQEDPFTQRFGPVAIDGLMGLCAVVLYLARTDRLSAPEPARIERPDAAPGATRDAPTEAAHATSEDEPVKWFSAARPEGAQAAVYWLYDDRETLLYVGCSSDLEQRLKEQRRQRWWKHVVAGRVVWFATKDEAADAEQRAILTDNPVYNVGYTRYSHAESGAKSASTVTSIDSAARNHARARRRAQWGSGPRMRCDCGCGNEVSKATRSRHRAANRAAVSE